MLFRLALAAVAGLSACSDDDPGVTVPGAGDLPGPGNQEELRQTVSLSGAYAEQIRILGDGWRATGSGQEITLAFEIDGIDPGVRQFELFVEPDPPAAFDLSTATFVAQSPPFLTPPFPGGIQLDEGSVMRMGWAIFGEPVPPLADTQAVGTLTIRTSVGFSALTKARLVVTKMSIGPSFTQRDNYGSDVLQLGVNVN